MISLAVAGHDEEPDPSGVTPEAGDATSEEVYWPSDSTPRWLVAALVALLLGLVIWAVVASV